MLFQVVTAGKTAVVIKQLTSTGTLMTKTINLLPGTILDIYGYANSDETRFVAWNEQFSATFFTVAVNDCHPTKAE